jgi:hypothetical protein
MIAEGDQVMVRMTDEGTHKGSSQEIPPAGKRASFPGILSVRIAHGKFAEMCRCIDLLELLRQPGATLVRQSGQAARGRSLERERTWNREASLSAGAAC